MRRKTIYLCTVAVWISLIAAAAGQPAEPTFLIFKYQHIVGKEIDQCTADSTGTTCHSHFQLDFTRSSISLDADIRTDQLFQPITFLVKGQNSTRSFVDLSVVINGKEATIVERGVTRTAIVPRDFFTIQQDVPISNQELLFRYWSTHGEPARVQLVPAGEVRIWRRGVDQLTELPGERLVRYTFHGVTWGDETVWVNGRGQIAAIVGADAEEDRVEFVRPNYQSALQLFVGRAAADAVAALDHYRWTSF